MIDPVERVLFLEGLFLKYKYDFRRYSAGAMDRRLQACLRRFGETSLLALLERVLRSPELFIELLPMLTLGTTDFFREPGFFSALKKEVFPLWRDRSPRIWFAGCSSGEEVISLVVLLHEAQLLPRCRIFASDINPKVLAQAKTGAYHLSDVRRFIAGYHAAGGEGSPSEYFSITGNSVLFRSDLLARVDYLEHDLTSGRPMEDMDLIVCRNVLIYFEKELQEKVLAFLRNSLRQDGILAIGRRESLILSRIYLDFEKLDTAENLYRLR